MTACPIDGPSAKASAAEVAQIGPDELEDPPRLR